MRPIRLPEPPAIPTGLGDVFTGGVHSAIRRAIIISNGFSGAENQCIGIVRALGLYGKHTLYRVTRPSGGMNEWFNWLPVSVHKKLDAFMKHVRFNSHLCGWATEVSKEGTACGSKGLLSLVLEADAHQIADMALEIFERSGPLLVVASGRDTVSVSSSVKRLAAEKVFLVQIQHPRSRLHRFDLVVTPEHDYYRTMNRDEKKMPRFLRAWTPLHGPPEKNVILTLGAPHQMDSAALRAAASTWYDEFAPLPKPMVVVNIGGPTRNCRYGADLAGQLVNSLFNVLSTCGSLRISFSRRTPRNVSSVLVKELGRHPVVRIWDGKEPNPHAGHLAWADAFVVTGDSISMLSEAGSTGKPVYVVGSDRCTGKFAEFHRSLRERGVTRKFTGFEDMSRTWSYPRLTDAASAAQHIRHAIAQRGWMIR